MGRKWLALWANARPLRTITLRAAGLFWNMWNRGPIFLCRALGGFILDVGLKAFNGSAGYFGTQVLASRLLIKM